MIVFLDTEHERNALMEYVYPKLREFCQKKGYEFQVLKINFNYQTIINRILMMIGLSVVQGQYWARL